eukprot:720208-Prymnesium_polylepis.1
MDAASKPCGRAAGRSGVHYKDKDTDNLENPLTDHRGGVVSHQLQQSRRVADALLRGQLAERIERFHLRVRSTVDELGVQLEFLLPNSDRDLDVPLPLRAVPHARVAPRRLLEQRYAQPKLRLALRRVLALQQACKSVARVVVRQRLGGLFNPLEQRHEASSLVAVDRQHAPLRLHDLLHRGDKIVIVVVPIRLVRQR